MDKDKNIPEKIKEYLASPRVVNVIENLGRRVDIADSTILPSVVFEFVSKKIDAAAIKQYIKERIKLREDKINTIILELKEKIFRPIQYDLKKNGIDIDSIDTKNFLPLVEFLKKEVAFLKSIGEEPDFDVNEISLEPETKKDESISLEVFSPDPESGAREDSIKVTTDESKKVSDASPAPFMLHREKPTVGTSFPEKKQKTGASSKSFSLPFGFFKPKNEQTSREPVRVKVELPGVLQKKEEKIIHYSELRTPVSPFQKEKSFIQSEEKIQPLNVIAPAPREDAKEKPRLPVDILQKKGSQEVNLQLPTIPDTRKNKEFIRNSIMGISTKTPQEDTKKTEISSEKKVVFNKEQVVPDVKKATEIKKNIEIPNEKPTLSGKGFFWKFKTKKKDVDNNTSKTPPEGPQVHGNKIDLRA